MRNIYFLIGNLSKGGAERAVSNISCELNLKNNSKLIIFGDDSSIEYPFIGEIIRIDSFKENNILQFIFNLVYRFFQINKIKKTDPNAVFISFLIYPNLLNVITRKTNKTFVSVRNHESTEFSKGIKSKIWNWTIKNLYPKADKIIAVSEVIKQDLIYSYKIDSKKIDVIYNSYDIDQIKRNSKKPIDKQIEKIINDKTIVNVGRLNHQKGHRFLIESFRLVVDEIPEARLLLIGDGPLKNDLKNLVDRLDLVHNVFFLGHQENPFNIELKSKLFVFSSLFEGFPNALAEAMACGLPVLSTDCPSGPREIISPKDDILSEIDYEINLNRFGVLTRNFDQEKISNEESIKELSKKIIVLLSDQKLNDYFKNMSYQRVNDFNIKHVIKDWKKLFGIEVEKI